MTEGPESFADALEESIERSGMSYRTLAEAISAADGPVSAPTLRAWASGRSVPTRRASFETLAVAERVLGERPGMLSRHLVERPTGEATGNAADGTERLQRLLSAIDDLREEWDLAPYLSATRDLLISSLDLESSRNGSVQHRSVMRAVHDGVSRVLLPVDPMGWSVTEAEDWAITLRGGRLGRFTRLDRDVAVIEVELPRAMHAGEVAVIDMYHAISERDRSSGWFNAITLIPTKHLVAKVTIPSNRGGWYFRRSAQIIDGTVRAAQPGPRAAPAPAASANTAAATTAWSARRPQRSRRSAGTATATRSTAAPPAAEPSDQLRRTRPQPGGHALSPGGSARA